MARSTWWQQCCTATSSSCSCTSAGRSTSCSSSPWCLPPASPNTTECNRNLTRVGGVVFWGFPFYLVCLKVLQRLIAFDELFFQVFYGFLQFAHLLRQLSMGSVVASLHLRPLFEETHERVAFSVPLNIFLFFCWAKAKEVGGAKVKGGGVRELLLAQGTNRSQQACLKTLMKVKTTNYKSTTILSFWRWTNGVKKIKFNKHLLERRIW